MNYELGIMNYELRKCGSCGLSLISCLSSLICSVNLCYLRVALCNLFNREVVSCRL